MTLEEIYSKQKETKARVEELNAEISILDSQRITLSQERAALLSTLNRFEEFEASFVKLVETFNQRTRR